jgi:hypothetical protein
VGVNFDAFLNFIFYGDMMKYLYVMVTAVESLPHNIWFGLFNNATNSSGYIASIVRNSLYVINIPIMAYSAVMAFSLITTICTIRYHNAGSEDALQVMI